MTTLKILTAAGALMLITGAAAHAQTLSTKDSSAIVDVSRNNELRFNRDYKGKIFSDVVAFEHAKESLFGGSYLVRFSGVYCSVSDQSVLNKIIDWNKGQRVSVTGTVRTTMFGDVALDDCKFTKS